MAGNQDYQAQLEALEELDAYLHGIVRRLQEIMREYSEKVSTLEERGLPRQVHDKVKMEFYMQSQNSVTQSCEITTQAISYVKHNIQTLEQLT